MSKNELMKELTELWEFKYNPNNMDDMILNESIKPKLKKALIEKPSLMLYGTPGVGKGTFAKIFLKDVKDAKMWINSSDHTGIDFIRERVTPFANAYSLEPMKFVVFNESDSLTQGPQGAQKALKQLMEDTQKRCRFIFLTNDITVMMKELQSRCDVIKIDNPPKKEIGQLCLKILKNENIKYNTKSVKSIIEKCYPDIRSTIRCLKENIINKKLLTDNTSSFDGLYKDILKEILKKESPDGIRMILRSNYISYVELYKYLYSNCERFKEPGLAIDVIGKFLGYNSTYAIKEINFMRMVIVLWNSDYI